VPHLGGEEITMSPVRNGTCAQRSVSISIVWYLVVGGRTVSLTSALLRHRQ
jgi:hypothetical protein